MLKVPRLLARACISVGLAGAIAFVLVAGAQNSFIRQPYLQRVTAEQATILWTSTQNGAGQVRYSVNGDLSQSATARVTEFTTTFRTFYQYEAELKGLTPGREYSYEVSLDGQPLAASLRFRTAGPGPFTFLAFGDSGTGTPEQARLARRMIENERPSLVLHTGDISQEDGTHDQLDATYFGVYAPLLSRAPVFPSPGNHDYYTDQGRACFSMQAPPPSEVPVADAGRYYSFDWSNVHFVSLNSNLLEFPEAAQRMLEWLDADLRRQRSFWKVVYFHHPPYPTGHHLDDPISALVRERVIPVLDRHNVQLVLNGHEHSYQRFLPLRGGAPADAGTGATYVITGGGGGVLHSINPTPTRVVGQAVHHYLRGEVRGANLTITAIDIDGRQIDRFTLTPPADMAAEAVVNSGSYTPALAPGLLFSVFGRNLATRDGTAPALPLPTQLADTRVSWNGQRLPLLSVSPYQINAQLPYGISGEGILRITTPQSFTEVPIVVGSAAPAILQIPSDEGDVASVYHWPSGTLVTTQTPARPGEYVIVYAVGLGEVDAAVVAGEPAPQDPAARVRHRIEVQIGSGTVRPTWSGLAPGYAGLYQINVRVPDNAAAGANNLRVIAGGVTSSATTIVVGAPHTAR